MNAGLTIVIGKRGSGKSLWAVHQVIEELRRTHRPIVTTLALYLDKLQGYMDEHFPGVCDGISRPTVAQRIEVIDIEGLRLFWRNRGRDESNGFEPQIVGEFGVDWKPWRSVCYILDEAADIFKAVNSLKTWGEFSTYLRQGRKTGDTIVAIAPGAFWLDKKFRVMADDCLELTNLYKMSYKGITAPRVIKWRRFMNCPPAETEEPTDSGSLRIDGKGIASLYNTAAGLGFVGLGADIGQHAKGIPWWLLPVGCIGLALAFWFVVHYGFGRVLGKAKTGFGIVKPGIAAAGGIVPKTETPTSARGPVSEFAGKVPATAAGASSAAFDRTNRPCVVAYVRGSHSSVVVTDDGREFEARQVLETPGGLVVDGELFDLAIPSLRKAWTKREK